VVTHLLETQFNDTTKSVVLVPHLFETELPIWHKNIPQKLMFSGTVSEGVPPKNPTQEEHPLCFKDGNLCSLV
jgi:hypothetical protein